MATADAEELAALHRLDEIWIELANIVGTCDVSRSITPEAEQQHHALLREARALYGRVQHLIGGAGVRWQGRYFDGFQDILGKPSVSAIYNNHPFTGSSDWHELWGVTASAIGQAIGRVEDAKRRGRSALRPEVVSRYRPLILALETVRQAFASSLKWVSRPFHVLDPLLNRLERWPLVRLLVLIGAVGAGIAFIIAVIFALGTYIA